VQTLLGHNTIAITAEFYANVTVEDVRAAMEATTSAAPTELPACDREEKTKKRNTAYTPGEHDQAHALISPRLEQRTLQASNRLKRSFSTEFEGCCQSQCRQPGVRSGVTLRRTQSVFSSGL
jgi:hypothetical protein